MKITRIANKAIFIIFAIICIIINEKANASPSSLNKFVIGAWVGPHQTKEKYLLYKKALFNTILDYYWEGDDIRKTFDLIQQIGGLNVILNLEQRYFHNNIIRKSVMLNEIGKFISQTKNNKSNIGYFLYDEPKIDDLVSFTQTWEVVSKMIPADKLTWINFIPDHYGGDTYENADRYLNTFKPTVIASALYPYQADINKDLENMSVYYSCLENMRKLSIKYKVPFWLFAQSASWKNKKGKISRRMPNEAEIRLQIYSSLAYGAKGIWYYNYVIPHHHRSIVQAILDEEDKPTQIYYVIKAINREILCLAPTLMKIRAKEIMHINNQSDYKKYCQSDRIKPDINGNDLLIGYYADEKGNNYMMIVNKELNEAFNNIVLKKGKDIKTIHMISKKTGREIDLFLYKDNYKMKMKAGDGILLKIIRQ